MATMKLTKEQVNLIFFELDSKDDEWEGFKLVDEGEWEDDGKYQYKEVVFEYEGKTWALDVDRSGSYFTDYYYGVVENANGAIVKEVEKVEV
ncbi:MAG: hypothetical protein KAS32_11725, partial [Candidatus Peribacteraceae bacterium]|nr:hypothetical protein [Candidatus Peribacteraceae bacterium]